MTRFHLLLAARILFFAALVVVLYGTFSPDDLSPHLMPWDKASHFTAFFGLTFIGLFAFPKLQALRLAAALSVVGALIELIQATPLIHRDAEFMDWVADTLGIAAAMAPMAALLWREV